ncbi:MAG: 50S ribosomal protein L15 [Thermoprotei archaeon]|nr:MAG: 50S ribosomal protein L15 [Thermoprotei archaeon]
MVVRRKKKSRSYRGYRNQGWGSVGQHRKSGSRGGRGAVGMCKHKWSWVLKYAPDWYGKHGFTPRGPEHTPIITTLNVGQIDELAEELSRKGNAIIEDGKIVIDVTKMGIAKVLGSGRVSRPIKLIAHRVSKSAKKKIEEAGGEIVILPAKG